MTTLFERLGGREAVRQVVESFYKSVLADKRINHFFDGIDMVRQKQKQVAFLTMVFGGPHQYSGKDMREGHRLLVQRGLDDSHVDAVIELLQQALKDYGAPPEDIAEVVHIANSVRDDVLDRH
jgi:hemoglobin